jgi:hypothetical protein
MQSNTVKKKCRERGALKVQKIKKDKTIGYVDINSKLILLNKSHPNTYYKHFKH